MERNAMPARRRLGLAALIVAAAAATPAALYAQIGQWPTRPVKLVVPFPPGGSTDAIGRLLAVELAKDLGQTVIVENKGGANGNIGSDAVAKAEPDGYTLLLSGVGSNAINYALYASMPYRDSDFAHVSLLATGPNVLVAAPDFRQDLRGLHPAGAREPGQVHPRQLGQRLVRPPGHGNAQAAGQDRSGARAVQGRRGGHHGPAGRSRDGAVPQPGHPVAAGAGRQAAGAGGGQRQAQSGVSRHADGGGVRLSRLRGRILVRPVGAGQDAARRDPAPEQATAKAMASAEMRQKLESVGFVVVGSDPQAYSGFVTSEIAKWGQAAKASGARMD